MYYKLERVGEINYNKYKNKMKIIKYNSIMDIDVLFEDYDYVAKHKQYIAFKNGTLTSPYDRTIYGVGYLGEGLFKKNINNKATKEYLGVYLDVYEAFNVYKEYKEELIKQIADKYKYRIPEILYEAMYNSEVEIDD